MEERGILHCDMNNFYASVECLHRPGLRGQPVAVCGDPTLRHGIVLAKNYPAKNAGVKTGMAIWQASRLCPGLVILPPNYPLYLRVARLSRDIYARYTDQIEPFGLDEAWLDVSSSGHYGSPEEIADRIRADIREELGITASVGVSFCKVFSKLGSDLKKPDATTLITRQNFRAKIWPLRVEELLYVGHATQEKLNRRCIYTIGQLARAREEVLCAWFGKWGSVLHAFSNGEDPSPVALLSHDEAIKSIGNSTTTPRDLVNLQDVKLILYVMAESVAARLREHGFWCQTVQVYVRDCQLNSCLFQAQLERPGALAGDIARLALELFAARYSWAQPVRSLGVRACQLIPAGRSGQLSLWENEAARERREKAECAVEDLRRRFGHASIGRASLMADRALGSINPKGDHIIHPVGFFNEAL